MKKVLSGITIIIILWISTIAIVGSKTKSEIEKIVERGNQVYSQYGLKVDIVDYQKSFFNAIAKIKIDVLDVELKDSISKEYGLSLPITTEYHIEHGPIFFRSGLGFGLSKIDEELEINSLFTPEYQKNFITTAIMHSNIDISFSKIANYIVSSDVIVVKDNNKEITISPFEIKGKSNLENLTGEMQMVMPLISFIEDDKNMTIESMTMNVKMDKLISKSLAMGKIDISMKNFHISDKQSGEIEVTPTFHIISHKDGEKTFSSKVEMDMDFNNSTTEPSLSDIDNLTLMVEVDGVGIKGMQSYQEKIKKIEQEQASIMIDLHKNPNNKEENYQKLLELQQKMAKSLFDSLKDILFKDKTAIRYNFKSQTKDKKESHGDVIVGYTGNIDFTKTAKEISQRVNSDIFSLFKLEMDISVDETHILALPNGDEFLQQLQLPMLQTMIKHKNKKYEIKGHLKNQELILNDENLTNTVLPLLKMFSQLNMSK